MVFIVCVIVPPHFLVNNWQIVWGGRWLGTEESLEGVWRLVLHVYSQLQESSWSLSWFHLYVHDIWTFHLWYIHFLHSANKHHHPGQGVPQTKGIPSCHCKFILLHVLVQFFWTDGILFSHYILNYPIHQFHYTLQVVDAPEILTVIGKIPYLSEFLNSLYDCQYKSFFAAFGKHMCWSVACPPDALHYLVLRVNCNFCSSSTKHKKSSHLELSFMLIYSICEKCILQNCYYYVSL